MNHTVSLVTKVEVATKVMTADGAAVVETMGFIPDQHDPFPFSFPFPFPTIRDHE